MKILITLYKPEMLSNLTKTSVDKNTCYWSMRAWLESLAWPYKTGHGCVPATPAMGRDEMWRLADPRRSLPGSLFQSSELQVQGEALSQDSEVEGNREKHQTAFSGIYLNQTLRNSDKFTSSLWISLLTHNIFNAVWKSPLQITTKFLYAWDYPMTRDLHRGSLVISVITRKHKGKNWLNAILIPKDVHIIDHPVLSTLQ